MFTSRSSRFRESPEDVDSEKDEKVSEGEGDEEKVTDAHLEEESLLFSEDDTMIACENDKIVFDNQE